MVRSSAHWWGQLFVYYGGIAPDLVVTTLLYSAYCSAMYFICELMRFQAAHDGTHLLAGCVTFLLVFRLQQCYLRFVKAQTLTMDALCSLRTIAFSFCAFMSQGEARVDAPEGVGQQVHTLLKVHAVRLCIAFAVSLKYHVRVAEMRYNNLAATNQGMRHILSDLIRLKGLLSEKEALLIESTCGLYEQTMDRSGCLTSARRAYMPAVDYNRIRSSPSPRARHMFSRDCEDHGGVGVPLLMLQLLRGLLMEPLGQKWGYPERFLQVFEPQLVVATLAYQQMELIIRMPAPFPYLQLCKVLLTLFIASYPLGMPLEHGVWGNIMVPTILSMALVGLERVANIVENPVGDHSAALSLYELIHEFEFEVESMFDFSERNLQGVQESWHELGSSFGMTAGAKLIGETCRAAPETRFADFFEWASLPAHTVEYIRAQSGDGTKEKVCCDSAELSSDSEDMARLIAAPDDAYLIKRCVALRGPEKFSARIRSQAIAVARFDTDDAAASVRSRLRGSSEGL